MNEIVIDRGPSPFLAIIDLECDQQYLTTVQGYGIIVATPTGTYFVIREYFKIICSQSIVKTLLNFVETTFVSTVDT